MTFKLLQFYKIIISYHLLTPPHRLKRPHDASSKGGTQPEVVAKKNHVSPEEGGSSAYSSTSFSQSFKHPSTDSSATSRLQKHELLQQQLYQQHLYHQQQQQHFNSQSIDRKYILNGSNSSAKDAVNQHFKESLQLLMSQKVQAHVIYMWFNFYSIKLLIIIMMIIGTFLQCTVAQGSQAQRRSKFTLLDVFFWKFDSYSERFLSNVIIFIQRSVNSIRGAQ